MTHSASQVLSFRVRTDQTHRLMLLLLNYKNQLLKRITLSRLKSNSTTHKGFQWGHFSNWATHKANVRGCEALSPCRLRETVTLYDGRSWYLGLGWKFRIRRRLDKDQMGKAPKRNPGIPLNHSLLLFFILFTQGQSLRNDFRIEGSWIWISL